MSAGTDRVAAEANIGDVMRELASLKLSDRARLQSADSTLHRRLVVAPAAARDSGAVRSQVQQLMTLQKRKRPLRDMRRICLPSTKQSTQEHYERHKLWTQRLTQ